MVAVVGSVCYVCALVRSLSRSSRGPSNTPCCTPAPTPQARTSIVVGLPSLPVPHQRRLSLVGDADGRDVVLSSPSLEQAILHHVLGVGPYLLRVVLHPPGLWGDLPVLLLRRGHDLAAVIEQDEARARRALVERADVLGRHGCAAFRCRRQSYCRLCRDESECTDEQRGRAVVFKVWPRSGARRAKNGHWSHVRRRFTLCALQNVRGRARCGVVPLVTWGELLLSVCLCVLDTRGATTPPAIAPFVAHESRRGEG